MESKFIYRFFRSTWEIYIEWIYRIIFFAIHLLFFLRTMLVMWGYAMTDPQLRDILFGNESGAAVIVILPTVIWASVLFFYIASLFVESSAGEKSMHERLLMRDAGAVIG